MCAVGPLLLCALLLTGAAAKHQQGAPRRKSRTPTPVALAQEILLRRTSPLLLQVGAHFGDFNESQLHGGVRGDSARRAVFTLLGSPLSRALLIEPNPAAFSILDRNLRARGPSLQGVVAMNAAVCPKQTGTVDFHVVSPLFAQDFPHAPSWAHSELSSMAKDSILRGVGIVATPTNAEKYVQTIHVPCYRPSDVMRTNSVEPSSVDALVVDTESLDVDVVQKFLEIPSLQPSLLIFEAHIASKQKLRSLMKTLRRRGYLLDCCVCYGPQGTLSKLTDSLAPRHLMNASQLKKCDSGDNAVAWDPVQLNLTAAVARNPSLWSWYERIGGAS
jgi:FkbM family methyltransferase